MVKHLIASYLIESLFGLYKLSPHFLLTSVFKSKYLFRFDSCIIVRFSKKESLGKLIMQKQEKKNWKTKRASFIRNENFFENMNTSNRFLCKLFNSILLLIIY